MPMKKSVPAAAPDAYIASPEGWQKSCAEALRTAVVNPAGDRHSLGDPIKAGK